MHERNTGEQFLAILHPGHDPRKYDKISKRDTACIPGRGYGITARFDKADIR
jgi:hypothetical protein